MYVYDCIIDGKPRLYFSLLEPAYCLRHGLPDAAIIGIGEFVDNRFAAEKFVPNPTFLRLFHDLISTNAPNCYGTQATARRIVNGSVHVMDLRSATPTAPPPLQDTIGTFEVANAK